MKKQKKTKKEKETGKEEKRGDAFGVFFLKMAFMD